MILRSTTEFRFRRRAIYQGLVFSEDHELAQRLTGGNLDLLKPNEALKAWDPVTQRERWRVPLTSLYNGGVLSTAGDLVFQGRADGHLVAYRAADGLVLKDIELGTGVLAAPMTYAINGEQYVAVAAGYGGGIGTAFPAGSAPYRYENYPRIIALKLSGGPVPLRRPGSPQRSGATTGQIGSEDDSTRRDPVPPALRVLSRRIRRHTFRLP